MEEKLGKTLIDDKLVDLDNTPTEELYKMMENIKLKEKNLGKQIYEELKKLGGE